MTNPKTPAAVGFHSLPHPAWLPRRNWPFHTFGIESNGSRIAVTETGCGPVLLFVHVGTWSFIWLDLVTHLAPDFRCVFFDAPGNGQTQDVAGSEVTLAGAARAVEAVIAALDLVDFTLVAHDLGGPAAIAAVAATPQRVRGIVAMNAFAWRPSGTPFRGMLALMGSTFMRELDVLTGFIPRITATSFGVGRHMDQPSRAAFFAGMGSRGRRAFHDYLRDARHCDDLYRTADCALRGSLAHVPLLTIFGERNDPLGFQPRWKELYPGARQVVVANGNHFPMCDAPDFVAATIRNWHREEL
jgi:haloalkane dehalogenase